MTTGELASILGPIGGVAGIAGGARWLIERSERLRREDKTAEEARRREDRDSAERLGAVLAQTAAAQARTADALSEMADKLARLESAISLLASKGNP